MTSISTDCDVLVIGSGMGGSALAYQLRESGLDVLVVERGERLPCEAENWDPSEVFERRRYSPTERWVDEHSGEEFEPGVHYNVGGNTKVYGACLPRFREVDFEVVEYAEGISPAWPITYEAIEPYYASAETALLVHGDDTGDRTAPRRSGPYPYRALPHEPYIEELGEAWKRQGLSPISIPVGVDLREGGSCIRCGTCDGFPCQIGAKAEAETSFLARAQEHSNVRVVTGAKVLRLRASGSKVTSAVVCQGDTKRVIRFRHVVLAAGAVNTAALLLLSGDQANSGLGNSSGRVGRNYMVHNSTFMVAVDPRRHNTTKFTKTLGLNQWYTKGPDNPTPLGSVQMLGKLRAPMISAARPHAPRRLLAAMTHRSMDLYLTTEDLPSLSNGVLVGSDGRIRIEWTPSNLKPHAELVRRMSKVMRSAGYPLVFSQRMGIETNSHMCGTAAMGDDPSNSVVAPSGLAHDLDNLWIADSSVFPCSAALNPALTIAANAMRIGDELLASV